MPEVKPGFSRREFVEKAAVITAGVLAGSTKKAFAQTPTPPAAPKPGASETSVPAKEPIRTPSPRDPLDVQIEETEQALKKARADKPKKKILEDLQKQLDAELNPKKAPVPDNDPRDAKVAALEKQVADANKKVDDLKAALTKDPNTVVISRADLDSLVQLRGERVAAELIAKQSPDLAQEAANRAQARQEIEGDKAETIRLKETAVTALNDAKIQAKMMKGRVELPVVGETDARLALGGAGVAGWGIFRGLGRFVGGPILERRRHAQETAALNKFLTDAIVTIGGAAITPKQTQLLVDNGYTIEEYQLTHVVLGVGFPQRVEDTLDQINTINAVPNPVDRAQQRKDGLQDEEDTLMTDWPAANPDQKRLIEVSLQRIFTQRGGAGKP